MPVVLRFQQYAIDIDGPEHDYVEAVLDHHAVEAWCETVAFENHPTGRPTPGRPAASFMDTQEIEPQKPRAPRDDDGPIIRSVILPP
jgi:hypothetical protein